MCLIIAAPSGQPTPKKHLENAYLAGNNDGWGISYWTGTKVLVRKGFDMQELLRAAKFVEEKPHVIHLRWATAGHKSLENCHPFRVHKNMYLSHNGILPFQPEKGDSRSDTAILAGMLRVFSPDNIVASLKTLGDMIGRGNKLAIQRGPDIHLVNGEQGLWTEDRWYSNDYYHLDTWGRMYHDEPLTEWEKWLMEQDGDETKELEYDGTYCARTRGTGRTLGSV